ncbi:MAG TPA: hypothetical protein PK185_14350 [Cyclobacteriaceae bacterium]|nr:hypothetical protein [Cyclobacteriaceae bacterium]
MRTIILALSLSLLLISCTKSFDEKIADKIEEQCFDKSLSERCEIALGEITEFEWDTLYVFNGLMTVDEINQALGFDCRCDHISDNYQRLMFVRNNQVVYHSEYYSVDGKVQFHPIEMNSEPKFSKKESEFFVVRKPNTLTSGYFYDLYPISRVE